MIGQMQGKFQLEVVGGVGHMVHEVSSFVSFRSILLLPYACQVFWILVVLVLTLVHSYRIIQML